jgi:putative acetyltransferase
MNPRFRIADADPQGHDAMLLLREAYAEAQTLYPEHFTVDSPAPTNAPTPARGAFLVATSAELGVAPRAVACASLRPLSATVGEIRRMFVTASARRQGLGTAMLQALEVRARKLGFFTLQLETGCRQHAALALYACQGYVAIEPYGEHVGDPTSRCFAKGLGLDAQGKS